MALFPDPNEFAAAVKRGDVDSIVNMRAPPGFDLISALPPDFNYLSDQETQQLPPWEARVLADVRLTSVLSAVFAAGFEIPEGSEALDPYFSLIGRLNFESFTGSLMSLVSRLPPC
jgi:hypothetical protein